MDATWGSGYGKKKDGKLSFTPRFDPYWFSTDPREFIFTHLPEEQKWQLIPEPIELKKFEKLQKLDDTFFKLGFDIQQVYSEAMSSEDKSFATTYDLLFDAKAVQLPYTKTLTKNEPVEFVIQSDGAVELVMIDGKNFIPFEKQGNTFSLSHQPKHKTISISGKNKKSGKTYLTIIEYKVKK